MNKPRSKGIRVIGLIITLIAVQWTTTAIGYTKTINVLFEAGVPKTLCVLDNLDDFTNKTGIKVNPIMAPSAKLGDRILADAMKGGISLYDVIMTFSEEHIPLLCEADYLEPLNKYFTNREIQDLNPASIEMHTWKGTLYGWSWYDHTVGILFYRTDLFDKYGVGAPPTTWQDFMQVAKKLTLDTDGDGNIDIYGTLIACSTHIETFNRIMSRILQAGGNLFDTEGNPTIDTPEAIAGLQFQIDMLRAKVSPPGSLNMMCVDGHTLFMQGKLAMFENWPYMYQLANDPTKSKVAGKFWVAPSVGKKRRTWVVTGFGWVVPKRSQNKKAAIEFIKWVTSKEMLIKVSLRESIPPNRKSLRNAPEFIDRKEFLPIAQAIAMGTPSPASLTPYFAEMRDIIVPEWQAALIGQKTAREAWKDAQVQCEAFLKEKRK